MYSIKKAFKSIFVIIFFWMHLNVLVAQNDAVAIGTWRSHLSYESIVAVTESQDAQVPRHDPCVMPCVRSDPWPW